GVRCLGESVHLARAFPRAGVRVSFSRLRRLLAGVRQVREPGADHLLDSIPYRSGTVIELELRGGEEAATGEHLPLRVADHVVAERPDPCQAFRRAASRVDHLADEELRRVIDGRRLELLLRAD